MTPFRCCGERYWLDACYDDRGEYVADVCTDDGAQADHCAVCGRSFEDQEAG